MPNELAARDPEIDFILRQVLDRAETTEKLANQILSRFSTVLGDVPPAKDPACAETVATTQVGERLVSIRCTLNRAISVMEGALSRCELPIATPTNQSVMANPPMRAR